MLLKHTLLTLTCAALLTAGRLFADKAAVDSAKIRHEEIRVKALFGMPAIRVPVFPARDFVITDFGAKPGGEIDNAVAIRKAVVACHEAGGGRVVIPVGEWLTGAVHLRSNVNLHLAKDAVLTFSDNPQDYLPAVQATCRGEEKSKRLRHQRAGKTGDWKWVGCMEERDEHAQGSRVRCVGGQGRTVAAYKAVMGSPSARHHNHAGRRWELLHDRIERRRYLGF